MHPQSHKCPAGWLGVSRRRVRRQGPEPHAPPSLDAGRPTKYNSGAGFARYHVPRQEVVFLPLYEYECTVCKHRFELLQKFSDKPAKVCVRCGKPVLRLISSPAIQFKGTGWYVTDYGTKSGTGFESKKKKARSSETTEKSETAPAASVETKPSKESSSTSTEKPATS